MRYITNEPISGEKALLTFLSNLYGKKSFVDWPITQVQQPVRSEWHIQDGGQLLKKTVPFLPAIAHKSETSTPTKFEMARPIFPWKCFLLFLALCDL